MSRPIQSPGAATQIEEEFAIKGGLALRVDEVVIPVLPIGRRRRKFAMGTAGVAAAAGFRSEVALVNPIPFLGGELSDTSVQVHKIWVDSGQGTENLLELAHPTAAITGFTNLATKSFLNFPLGVAPVTSLLEDNTDVPQVAVVFAQQRVLTSTPFLWDFSEHPIILDSRVVSGNALLVRPSVDNTAIVVTILWSEPADPA